MPLRDYLGEFGGGEVPLPEIAEKYEGKGLIVCADAACIWDDLERFGARCDHRRGSVAKDGFDIMVVNKAVEVLPGHIEHAYSNQPKLLNTFIAARRNEYRSEFQGPKHTHSCQRGAKWHWPWGGWGTSLLGACLTGVGLGYDHIVICGGPLDNGPHNGEPHWRKCRFTNEAADTKDGGMNHYWRKAMRLAFDGKVKSMSGRTREWLGAP